MVLMPPGTMDPTPHIYDSTMYALSGLMAVAFLSHAMVGPLNHATLASAKATKVIDVKESVDAAVSNIAAFGSEKETIVGSRQVNNK